MSTIKNKMVERIQIRCTEEEKNIIKTLAMLYANGNISAYIIKTVLYGNRQVVKNGDFELSDRRIKRNNQGPKPPTKD